MNHVLPNGLVYEVTKDWLLAQEFRETGRSDLGHEEDKYHDLLLQMLEADPVGMRPTGWLQSPLFALSVYRKQWYSKRKLNRELTQESIDNSVPDTDEEEGYYPDYDTQIMCSRALKRLDASPRAKQAMMLKIQGFGESEAAAILGITRQSYWQLIKHCTDTILGGRL